MEIKKPEINLDNLMVLYDAPSGKHIPCLYEDDGTFIAQGSIEFTGKSKIYPNLSYFTREATVSFKGYGSQTVNVMFN